MTQGPLLCKGDSGGPALSDNDAVIGTFSEVVGNCADSNASDFFTEIAPFATDIILPAFEAAGAVPWLEGNSEPGLYGTGGSANTGGDSSTGGASAVNAAGGAGGVIDTAAGGAPAGTGGDTSTEPFVYDQKANGGSCACRTAGNGRRGFGVLAIAALAVLGLRRRLSHKSGRIASS
jgi:MYXO-CTERM domain-containing protein